MLAGTYIKKSCSSIGPILDGRAYYALRKLSILSAILLDAHTRQLHVISTPIKSASASMVFIMVSVGKMFHTNIILWLKVKMLTALCEWTTRGIHPL